MAIPSAPAGVTSIVKSSAGLATISTASFTPPAGALVFVVLSIAGNTTANGTNAICSIANISIGNGNTLTRYSAPAAKNNSASIHVFVGQVVGDGTQTGFAQGQAPGPTTAISIYAFWIESNFDTTTPISASGVQAGATSTIMGGTLSSPSTTNDRVLIFCASRNRTTAQGVTNTLTAFMNDFQASTPNVATIGATDSGIVTSSPTVTSGSANSAVSLVVKGSAPTAPFPWADPYYWDGSNMIAGDFFQWDGSALQPLDVFSQV